MPLFSYLLTFFLLLALAEYAFRDYFSINEILNAAEEYKTNCSENKNFEIIHFAVLLETSI